MGEGNANTFKQPPCDDQTEPSLLPRNSENRILKHSFNLNIISLFYLCCFSFSVSIGIFRAVTDVLTVMGKSMNSIGGSVFGRATSFRQWAGNHIKYIYITLFPAFGRKVETKHIHKE